MKSLDLDSLRPLAGFAPVDESKLANVSLRLDQGRTLNRGPSARTFKELTRTKAATAQIGELPARGCSTHCVLNGSYALWNFVPAVLALTGNRPIERLRVATLGFSKQNVADMMDLAGQGLIKQIDVLCSHYFSAADAAIYGQMVQAFTGTSFRVCAMRTHAKILLMQTGVDWLTVESSANLRSCHNVETATLINEKRLHDFHAAWIDELMKGSQR